MPESLGMLEQGHGDIHDRRATIARGLAAFARSRRPSRCALETDEPARVAEATRRMNLKHVVITAVARDDLADGGAEHFRQTIEKVRELNPGIVIEVLVPDFLDRDESIDLCLAANPHIYNHNLETVRRLTPERAASRHLRPFVERAGEGEEQAGRFHLHQVRHDARPGRNGGGIDRRRCEDLRQVRCDILTLGQYLQPTLRHLPVVEFVSPAAFARYKAAAEEMGFVHVASGPMVRSSYHADEFKLPLRF